jgi:hypothetical protein
LPVYLHFSHDRNQERTREDLNAGVPLLVDVVALDEDGNLAICGTLFGQRNLRLVGGSKYDIGIRVAAESSGYIDKGFQVWEDKGKLCVREINQPC